MVLLDCVANGDPPPTISWQWNDGPLTPDDRCACHYQTSRVTLPSLPLTLPSPPLTLPSLLSALPPSTATGR